MAKRPVIYVAGPIRGGHPENHWHMEKNIRRGEELALACWEAGFAAISPHSMSRFFQGALPDQVWLDGDLDIIERCDAVLLTHDWEDSLGAIGEKAHAEKLGIPVFHSLHDMVKELIGAGDEV